MQIFTTTKPKLHVGDECLLITTTDLNGKPITCYPWPATAEDYLRYVNAPERLAFMKRRYRSEGRFIIRRVDRVRTTDGAVYRVTLQ